MIRKKALKVDKENILYIQKNKNKNENILLIGKYQERRQLSSSFKY